MTATHAAQAVDHHNDEIQKYEKTVFGFWIYLMTDCVLFATFFAAYAVLHKNVFGGQTAKELFSMPFALGETLILLTSSFTCGLAMLAVYRNKANFALLGFLVTFFLGIAFLAMELYEFTHLVREGNSWQRNAFLSSYFSLVGCHGLHITCGLFWMLIMMLHVTIRGLTMSTIRRLTCLSMFWHFLDVIWILIFTIVYLMGAI